MPALLAAAALWTAPALANNPPASETAQTFDLRSLHATYRYVGGEKQKAAIAKAIDAGIEPLPAGLKDMAHKRISKSQQAWPTMRIDIEGDDIKVDRGPEKPVHTTAASPKYIQTNKGERYVWRQRVNGRTLAQDVTGVGNKTTIRYRFNEDGSRLTFKISIDATLLPAPITYKLTYARID